MMRSFSPSHAKFAREINPPITAIAADGSNLSPCPPKQPHSLRHRCGPLRRRFEGKWVDCCVEFLCFVHLTISPDFLFFTTAAIAATLRHGH
jgi:hypothetical protein